jgi:hypothetical protein
MRCIFHVGLPKTGSTTVQRFFCANRKLLSDNRILYPKSLGPASHRELILLANPKSEHYRKVRGGELSPEEISTRRLEYIDAFRQELDLKKPETVILSSEQLVWMSAKCYKLLERVLRSVGLDDISVCMYLRPQAQWRASIIQQRIKVGGWSDADNFPVDSPEDFGKRGSYKQHILKWAKVFGENAIKPRLFGTPHFANGDLLDDILWMFELPDLKYYVRPERQNEGLSEFACRMLMELNRSVPRFRDGKECARRKIVRKLVGEHMSTAKSKLPPAKVSPDMMKRYENYYHKDNEWVRRRFFPERATLFQKPLHETPTLIPAEPYDALAQFVADAMKNFKTPD